MFCELEILFVASEVPVRENEKHGKLEKSTLAKRRYLESSDYEQYACDGYSLNKLEESRSRCAKLFGDKKFELNILSLSKYLCPVCGFVGEMSNDGGLSNFMRHIRTVHKGSIRRMISHRWNLIKSSIWLEIMRPFTDGEVGCFKSVSRISLISQK